MTKSSCDPVGTADIATRLGVKAQTVAQWKLRTRLPPPAGTVSGLPWWHWADIEAWARETGRPRAQKDPQKS